MRANIHTWADLKQFGINPLTGEACKYSMRLLCDMSDKGVDLVLDYFGMPHGETVFAKNWNSMVGDDPAVASIMLSRDAFGSLCRFALFRAGYDIVLWTQDGGWYGYTEDELPEGMTQEKLTSMYKAVYRNPAPQSATSRNTHAMSGRQL